MSILPHCCGSLPLPQSPGIYAITHVPSGRSYIGSAVNLRTRQKQHQGKLQQGAHPNKHLQNAWNKYGASAFLFRVLDYVDDITELLTAEQQWIDTARPAYNIRIRARSNIGLHFLGHSPSAETREKISQANRGKTITAEHRASITQKLKGYKHSPARNAKISATKHDPLRAAAISDGLRRRWAERLTPQALAIRAGIPATEDVLSIKEAAMLIGCTGTSIRRMIHDGTLPATLIGKFWVLRRVDVMDRLEAIQQRLNKTPHKRRRPNVPPLTPHQMECIRQRYAVEGISMAHLGKEFGICASRVWRIVRDPA